MTYTTTTLATLLLRLEERYESAPYWTSEEGRYALNEALRVWNMLTGSWRKRETMLVGQNVVWLTLPGAMSFGARLEWNSRPLEETTVFDLDVFRPTWRNDRTTSGGRVPTVPTHWAPAGVFRVALWPALGSGSGTLTVDGLRKTPVLRALSDTVDLNQTEERPLVGYGLHYLSLKQGGRFWLSTRQKHYPEFLKAAGDANTRLRLSAFFRRYMGLDLDGEQRPIIRRPRAEQERSNG